VTSVPEEVRRWTDEREAARRRRDFAEADALRERIRQAGWAMTDTPAGPVLAPGPPPDRPPAFGTPEEVPSLLDDPPTADFSVQWFPERWPEDVLRGIGSFRRFQGTWSVQHVVVESGRQPAEWPDDVDVVSMRAGVGWGAARNAGLRRAAGHVVVVADGSVQAEGDVLTPLVQALRDPWIGMTGPFGVVSDDLRQFRDSAGPEVDAIEAYLLAFRRELLLGGLRFDPQFAFYRNADLDLSLQVKALGLRVVVTPVPVRRHAHRGWESVPGDRRDSLSKRNFYRFLDRWRSREDLLVANRRDPSGGTVSG